MKPIYVLLLFSVFASSCKVPVEKHEAVQTLTSKVTATDPLFFIEGQLCQHLRKITQDKSGDLWFGTNVYGIMRYNGDSLESFDDEVIGIDFSRITGFAYDKDSNLWISAYQGISKYDGHSFTLFTDKEGLLDSETWCITIDSKGLIWVGTNKGISRFDGKKFSTFAIPKAKVKSANTVYSADRIVGIVEDKMGNIWFGTIDLGFADLMVRRSQTLQQMTDFAITASVPANENWTVIVHEYSVEIGSWSLT